MITWDAPPDALLATLAESGVRRGWLVTDLSSGEVRASHGVLTAIARSVGEDRRDYRGHHAVFFEIGSESGHLLGAFIHKTARGQAAGGVRFWDYPTIEAWMRDGLRLSRGMGHKNALAGLWWGGGKGVVARRAGTDHLDSGLRVAVYRDYGRFMSGLRGCYVTAEDAGTTPADMAHVHATTRHTTCVPPEVGGSGNPSVLTAQGVICAMEAALEWSDAGDLAGKTVATQGLGNVARHMIGGLLERGVERIIGADVDQDAYDQARALYPDAPLDLRKVAPGDHSILAEACDVLAPNATGAILNPATIPTIAARVVCGGANNQLEDADRDAPALADRGILYVPDFLANRMGIVNCANEQYGSFDDDPAILAHLDRDEPTGIFRRAIEIFDRARSSLRTPAHEAEVLAEELMLELHPIWGDRARTIIDALVRDGWAD